jgi:hypothetical protein
VPITYSQLGRDYRAVMKTLRPGWYEYVTAEHDGRKYRVFQLSIWDQTIDGYLTGVLELSSRTVKDNTVFFLNVARDLMINLKIRGTGAVFYLIEPRPAAQRLLAARLGITVDEYEKVVLEGGLRDLALHDVEALRRRYNRRIKRLRTETAGTMNGAAHLASENARLANETSALMGKLGVTHDDLFVSRNMLNEREAEIRLLREFIITHGLTAPNLRPTPPWNPG